MASGLSNTGQFPIVVNVYADRILVGTQTIMAQDLVELYYEPRDMVRIEHTSPWARSPLYLKLRLPDELHDAILVLFGNRAAPEETG